MIGYTFTLLLLLNWSPCGGSSSDAYLHQFLQIDDIDSGSYDNPDLLPPNSCARECVNGDSKICYYKFTFEEYSTLGQACTNCIHNVSDCYNCGCVTADGFERMILSCNRRLPGPSIQVCHGDRIVVDVTNKMNGRSTTVHWHGIRQVDHKFMDGVPMVTQCPIHHSETFRYDFLADAPGLHFYHSHDGLQKVDGLVGGLVVRQPRNQDPNSDQYYFDLPSHLIVIQDWHHLPADAMFPGLRYRSHNQMAQTYLINGRGQWLMTDGHRLANTPLAQINVKEGYRYVIRVVAGTCFECHYVFTIEKHDFIVIGADVESTKPLRVDSVTMSPGERYSLVVNCNRPVASYWVQVKTVGFCSSTGATQVAVLTYDGASRTPSSPAPTFQTTRVNHPGLTLNPVNCRCTAKTRETVGPCITDLRSATDHPEEIYKDEPDLRIVMAYGVYPYRDNLINLTRSKKYTSYLQTSKIAMGVTINGIINMLPPSPLLSQYKDVPQHMICAPDLPHTWNTVLKECVHVVKVPVNKTVEIISISVAKHRHEGISHGIHLHGYNMHIVEMGVLNESLSFHESVIKLLETNRTSIPKDMVAKDVVAMPAGGYFVSRMFTDNPGFWFFHCHLAYHIDAGMSGILQVGEVETFPPPPEGFPTCGNFLPPVNPLRK